MVEGEHIKLAITAANNHYAGFAPSTVNRLPEAMIIIKNRTHNLRFSFNE
ncbi:MAG: hypothetical protein WBF33_34380 [Candidatus Nitrosopolaris sp.]